MSEIDNFTEKPKQDVLRINLSFNGKTIRMEEKGDTAYPTYVEMMGIFTKKNESARISTLFTF